MESIALIAVGIVLAPVTIYWLLSVSSLYRVLRRDHSAMYARIGSPTMFSVYSPAYLVSFLLTRKPESLADPQLLRRAWKLRITLAVYVPLVIAWVGLCISQ